MGVTDIKVDVTKKQKRSLMSSYWIVST